MLNDIALTWGAFGRLPEAFAYIVRRHSTAALENSHVVASRLRHASLAAGWTPVRVFELEAADILALDEAGLGPFALAAHWDADGEQLAQQVRGLVDRQVGDPGQQANLLAVCQVFAEINYSDARVFEILGGRKMALQSAWMREAFTEEIEKAKTESEAIGLARGKAEGITIGTATAKTEAILHVLRRRFTLVPHDVVTRVQQIDNLALLDTLLDRALACRRLEQFTRALPH